MASSTFHIDGKKIVIPTTRVITPKTGKLRMCSACSAFESKTKKLLMCSACRDAWYCDRKCQLADRKDHKPSCALRQFHKEALTLDDSKLVSEIPEGSGPINTLEKPLLTDFAEEFHEFTSKFRFDLLEAYVLAHTMQPKQTTDVPQVLYVRLIRVPNPLPSSRPWSRFDIRSVESCTFPELRKAMPPAIQKVTPLNILEAAELVRRAQLKAQARYKRMSIIIISGASPTQIYSHHNPEPFGKIVTQSYMLPEILDYEEAKNWKNRLIATVREKCGRSFIEEVRA